MFTADELTMIKQALDFKIAACEKLGIEKATKLTALGPEASKAAYNSLDAVNRKISQLRELKKKVVIEIDNLKGE